jgi:FKBP-type peptidyl-prolyl cis-trans isomerase FklB
LVAGFPVCVKAAAMLKNRYRSILALLVIATAVRAEDSKPSASPAASASPSASASAESSESLKDEKDKLSYSVGVDIGRTIQRLNVDLNQGPLTQGILDVLGNRPMALSDDELQQRLQAFQQKLAQKQEEALAQKQQEMKASAEKNKVEGKKFLDENAKKEGVTTLPDGLQYKVIKQGTGDKPKATDVVEVNYRGTFIDGKEFDSSEKNGGPVSFPVNEVIKGWSEALTLMPIGSKWQLFIPSDLAYGDEGEGDDIQPGSTLVFDVELLGVKKEEAQPAATPEANASGTPAHK